MMSSSFRLAAIQAAPFFFDREKSTDKACLLIEEAGRKGANLAAFGEGWLPGYPWFPTHFKDAAIAYMENAVEIPGKSTDLLCQVAGDTNIDVAIGIMELDKNSRGTTYCTLLFISKEGKILGKHRKLKPTWNERIFWGEGDGAGLRVYDRPYAKIGGLNCGEHNMMLPEYALAAQGVQVHVATWPFPSFLREGRLLSRAFALQGRCYVLCVASAYNKEYLSESLKDLHHESLEVAEYGSCIIDPNAQIIAQAKAGEEIILTAEGSLDEIKTGKLVWDIAGHYSRPDIFQLTINRNPMNRVNFIDENEKIYDPELDKNGEDESFKM